MKRGIVLVAMALLGLPGLASAPAQDPAPKGQETQDRLRDSYRRLLARFRSELQPPDARPWDVAARAESLGNDPAKILEFVRTKIRFEPYPGMQRGPAGVLASGGGNSADKAFLLAELLRARGHKARIVRATLKRAQAEELARAALAEAKIGPLETIRGPFGAGAFNEKRHAGVCGEIGLSTEEFGRIQKAGDRDRSDRWNEVLDVTEREFGFLRGQFGEGRVREIHGEIVEWLRTHYWVQWQPQGNEEWTNLDPSFPGLEAGKRAAEAEGEVVDPAAVSDLFRISLRLDRKVGGKRETVSLLEGDLPVHDTLLRPIRFVIIPDRGLDDLMRSEKPMTEAQLRERLREFKRFQGVLTLGTESVGSKAFDMEGRVFSVAANGSLMGATAAEKVKAATDLFGDAPKVKTELLALNLRLSVVREGKECWSRDRVIVEEGEKVASGPILSWNLFFQSHAFSDRFARGLAMAHAVRGQGFLERAMDQLNSKGSLMDAGTPGFYYPFALLSFARARQAFAQLNANGRSMGLLWEHADLFISGTQVRLKGGGGLCLCEGFDIVENGALAIEAGDRFALRPAETCALGTFDTVLEQVLLREANPSETADGTLAPFERARILGEPLRVLPSDDARALKEAGLSETDAAWIGRHARPGERVLLAQGRAGAWWSHDPATGRTIGRISGGRGGCEARGVSGETVINLTNGITWAGCLGVFLVKLYRAGPSGGLEGRDLLSFGLCTLGAALGIAGTFETVAAGTVSAGTAVGLALSLIGSMLSVYSAIEDP